MSFFPLTSITYEVRAQLSNLSECDDANTLNKRVGLEPAITLNRNNKNKNLPTFQYAGLFKSRDQTLQAVRRLVLLTLG